MILIVLLICSLSISVFMAGYFTCALMVIAKEADSKGKN